MSSLGTETFHRGRGMPWDAVGCRGMPWVAVGCHWAVPSLVKPCSYVGEVNGGGQAFEVEVISIYLGYVEVVPGLRRPGTPIAS